MKGIFCFIENFRRTYIFHKFGIYIILMKLKKICYIFMLGSMSLLCSCENDQFVGSWHKESQIDDCGFPLFFSMPMDITLNADYSYTTNGGFIIYFPALSGTYTLTPDSIFFGSRTFERFKIAEISPTRLTIERVDAPLDTFACMNTKVSYKR
jgi:hypothetical protein